MPSDTRPGLDPRRLVRLMREAVDRCDLDLDGLTVLTEAASGAYVVTPVLAAMAGADVVAVAAGDAHSPPEGIPGLTRRLAPPAGGAQRIQLLAGQGPPIIPLAPILTNSRQGRPV